MSDPDRRIVFLQEMGLGPIWASRHVAAPALLQQDGVQDEHLAGLPESITLPVALSDQPANAFDDVVASGLDLIDSKQAAVATQSDHPVAYLDWTQLQEIVSECRQCSLCHTRTQTVFGTGDVKARWLFVGEGPGRNEDFQGQPFVGPAGKLLDNMMVAMGLKRGDDTYIANIVKCRPTDTNRRDRPPTLEEAAACMPYLERQIALINPTVIVALGKTAALSLLKLDPATPVSRLRGTVHRFNETPLIVTYHPAYLLRNLKDKGKVWSDLCLAMQTFAARD